MKGFYHIFYGSFFVGQAIGCKCKHFFYLTFLNRQKSSWRGSIFNQWLKPIGNFYRDFLLAQLKPLTQSANTCAKAINLILDKPHPKPLAIIIRIPLIKQRNKQ
jgi:hypothetical protein